MYYSIANNANRTVKGHVLIAHNEDWLPDTGPNTFLVHATPENEPTDLAMTYGGRLLNIDLNAFGIAQYCDTVYPNDVCGGVPRVFPRGLCWLHRLPGERYKAPGCDNGQPVIIISSPTTTVSYIVVKSPPRYSTCYTRRTAVWRTPIIIRHCK